MTLLVGLVVLVAGSETDDLAGTVLNVERSAETVEGGAEQSRSQSERVEARTNPVQQGVRFEARSSRIS